MTESADARPSIEDKDEVLIARLEGAGIASKLRIFGAAHRT